jgi:signal transduction histidine kinase
MLELTRLEQQPKTAFPTVDLSRMVKDAIDLAEPLFEAQRQILKTEIAQKCPIAGDTSLLFRMCFNVLENASKHAGAEAVVDVELTDKELCVRDNGPGIPDTELEKVLQRFYRLDSSRSVPGYGLGLPFVRAICELHDMKLTLSNNFPGLKVAIRFKEQAIDKDI